MGTITVTTFGADPQTVNAANLNALVTPIVTECNGNLDNTNIKEAAGIVDTKLATITTSGKVNTSALTTTSAAAGDVLYHNGTNWVRLAKDAGKYLKSGASSVSWDTPSTTGTLTAGSTCTQNPVTVGTITAQAHGLGAAPNMVHAYLECLSADLGYSVGDKIQMLQNVTGDSGTYWIADATNISIITASGTDSKAVNKGTPAGFVAIDESKWKAVAIPYKIN